MSDWIEDRMPLFLLIACPFFLGVMFGGCYRDRQYATCEEPDLVHSSQSRYYLYQCKVGDKWEYRAYDKPLVMTGEAK